MSSSLHERLGGTPAITRICDALYARVLLDDRLSDFFLGLDISDLVHRQARFFDCLLDDRKANLMQLRKIHQPLVNKRGLMPFHFDAMAELLDEVMADVGIDALLRREVMQRVEATRSDVLGQKKNGGFITRLMGLVYGGLSYAVGMASLVVIGLWLGNIGLVTGLDAPRVTTIEMALVTNVLLVIVFSLQHSGMARPGFKHFLTRFIPQHLERSTYVLVSGIATIGLVYYWQPMGGTIWALSGAAMMAVYTIYAVGWALLVASTFWINHFDLFGLRQVWLNFQGRAYSHIPFQTPGLYRFIRHPLYVGWLMVMWAAPVMTISHLAFAILTTVYIFVAIRYEEKDLVDALPEYRAYKDEVPMMIPSITVNGRQEGQVA